MRYSSVVVGASVAALVAISVGACAATPTSPSFHETTPAASASVSATSSTDVGMHFDLPSKQRHRVATAIDECGSIVVCVHPVRGADRQPNPGRRTSRAALVRMPMVDRSGSTSP